MTRCAFVCKQLTTLAAQIVNISFHTCVFANLVEPSICLCPCCYLLIYDVTGRHNCAKRFYESKKENKQTKKGKEAINWHLISPSQQHRITMVFCLTVKSGLFQHNL